MFSIILQKDLLWSEKIVQNYYIGNKRLINDIDSVLTWKALEDKNIKILEINGFRSFQLSKKILLSTNIQAHPIFLILKINTFRMI